MAHLEQQAFTRVRRMNPAVVERYMEQHGHRTVLIYSREHHAFWRAGAAGYTSDPKQAGQYELRDAYARTSHCGPEKEIVYELIA